MAESTATAGEILEESSSSLEQTEKTVNPTDQDTAEKELVQTVEEIDYQPDCPVCLQSCYYPVKLPCGHIFCFLCIKGVALRSRKCALCRHSLGTDYLENPTLIKVVDRDEASKEGEVASKPNEESSSSNQSDGSQEFVWYYEGRNGWWLYDEKTSSEVEKALKSGQRSCTLLIAGFLYVIDFENMFQTRKNEPGRRRRIKRDKRDVESKGVAGIRIPATASLYSNAPPQTIDSKATDKTDNFENQTDIDNSTGEDSQESAPAESASNNTLPQASAEEPDRNEVAEITSSLEEASLKER